MRGFLSRCVAAWLAWVACVATEGSAEHSSPDELGGDIDRSSGVSHIGGRKGVFGGLGYVVVGAVIDAPCACHGSLRLKRVAAGRGEVEGSARLEAENVIWLELLTEGPYFLEVEADVAYCQPKPARLKLIVTPRRDIEVFVDGGDERRPPLPVPIRDQWLDHAFELAFNWSAFLATESGHGVEGSRSLWIWVYRGILALCLSIAVCLATET